MEARYQLTLTGQLLPGFTLDDASANLGRLIKLPPEHARMLLTKAPVVLQNDLPHSKLDAYLQHFARTGVEVRSERLHVACEEPSLPPESAPDTLTLHAAEEDMHCPACGKAQPKRTLCIDCGANMPALLAAKEQAASQPPPAMQAVLERRAARYEARDSTSSLPLGKILLFLALLAGAAWWYFHASRVITQEHVEQFYADYQNAMLSRDPERVCALLADEHVSRINQQQFDRKQTCDGTIAFYREVEKQGEALDGVMHLDSHYQLGAIKIASNDKEAVVSVNSRLNVGGSILEGRAQTSDTLIRRNGKVLLLRSEGYVVWRAGNQTFQ